MRQRGKASVGRSNLSGGISLHQRVLAVLITLVTGGDHEKHSQEHT